MDARLDKENNSIITADGYVIKMNHNKLDVTCAKGKFTISCESILNEKSDVVFLMYDDLDLDPKCKDIGVDSSDFEHVYQAMMSVGFPVEKNE